MSRFVKGSVLAILVGAVLTGCGTGGNDCDSFVFRSAEFKRDIARIAALSKAARAADLDQETPAEERLRAAAVGLVQCGKLRGQTPEQVRALLGRPTYTTIDNNPRPHRQWEYLVGFTPDRGSDSDEILYIELQHRRVVYAQAPGRERGGPESKDGELVSGGPRLAP
jgi:hypothetical protein